MSARAKALTPVEDSASVVLQVFGFRSGGFRWYGQWLAFVGLEVLGCGRIREVVAERRGADKAEVVIEGDEAAVEGFVVEGA